MQTEDSRVYVALWFFFAVSLTKRRICRHVHSLNAHDQQTAVEVLTLAADELVKCN